MTLATTVPNDWVSVSNGREHRFPHAVKEGKRILEKYQIDWFLNSYADKNAVTCYEFEQTPKISTYLYAICAGPYKIFEDDDPQSVQ
jgi:hypothetical protein